MAAISIRNIEKSFGKSAILKGPSLDVADGEFVVLLGPSGCGKTTLLRMIAGLEFPDAGSFVIDGVDRTFAPPASRNLAMVFQSYALYPHMTVEQNIAFPLTFTGMPKQEIAAKVREAAMSLGLCDLLQRPPKELSGGQRQRVAMGRALVRQPVAFLFDEPLSNLDAKLRVQMRTEIKALHQRLGTTMIYVTHDQIEATTMANRIVVMRAGSIEQIGAPLQVYDRPVNRFVASFIGSPGMNFLPGRLADGGAHFLSGDVSLALAAARPDLDGRAVTLGIRPEHISLSADGVPASVHVVEPTGYETIAVLKVAGTEMTMLAPERLALRPQQRVSLTLRRDCVHFFDADGDEKRLEGLALAE